MRPMFLEFANDVAVFDLASQFMFGDNILYSAKLNPPKDSYWQVDTFLPSSSEWYNYNTDMLESRSGAIHDSLSDLQQAIWIRAGSIVPILAHNNELSLLRALENDISLDVFLSSN